MCGSRIEDLRIVGHFRSFDDAGILFALLVLESSGELEQPTAGWRLGSDLK